MTHLFELDAFELPGTSTIKLSEVSAIGTRGSMSFARFLTALRDDPRFCLFFNDALAACRHAAFRWELPRLDSGTLEQPFECVLVPAQGLARAANPRPFERELRGEGDVVIFQNIGGDATLIVPTARTTGCDYAHLASFSRGASREQVCSFWSAVGGHTLALCASRPVWLSTAGAGVAWLHVRLDERPKYYAHHPYR